MSDEETTFHGRCSKEQKRKWEAAAKLAKRKFSDWARLAMDEIADAQLLAAQGKDKRKG
jgi:hypothetical protein